MNEKEQMSAKLFALVTGSLIGILSEAFGEMVKELRRNGGSDLDNRLDVLEANAVRGVENAPFDNIPENEQVLVIEQTRFFIHAIFANARMRR